MIGKPLAAIATAWALALAGCVIPEPITEEPPAVVPDQGLLIYNPPPFSTVQAQAQGPTQECIVHVSIPQVLDPSGSPLTARIFLNLNSPGPDQALTDLPLSFEGGTDLSLQAANEDQPTLQDLPDQPIDLNAYLPYLQPSDGSQPNFLEIFISDGFSDDQATLWQPLPGKLYASVLLYLELTQCPQLLIQ